MAAHVILGDRVDRSASLRVTSIVAGCASPHWPDRLRAPRSTYQANGAVCDSRYGKGKNTLPRTCESRGSSGDVKKSQLYYLAKLMPFQSKKFFS
ncbi:MAG: hypothetical protein DWQ05_21890 [Calditrichaeota bacterium]|nr:MAG: hypothetical protein DWQ05_21890 [Calditrichota bacterium]